MDIRVTDLVDVQVVTRTADVARAVRAPSRGHPAALSQAAPG